MIQSQQKQFQVVLWAEEDRHGSTPALRMDFDLRDEALAEFGRQRHAGVYRSGILVEWHKVSGVWDLIEQFP